MKSLKEVGVDVETGKIDVDLLYTGKPKSVRDKLAAIMKTIVEMQMEEGGMISHEAVLSAIETEYKIPPAESERLIQQLLRENSLYEPPEGYLKKACFRSSLSRRISSSLTPTTTML